MATTTAKVSNDTAAPTFSYAQAAKGIAPKAEDPAKKNEEEREVSGDNDQVAAQAQSESRDPAIAPMDMSLETEALAKGVNGHAKPVTSSTTSPSLGTASVTTLAKDEDIVSPPNGSADAAWDKESEVSTSADKSSQTGSNSKAKSWRKEPEPVPELKAAPIPAVNIWKQRIEAYEAKTKVNVTSKPSATPSKQSQKPAASNPESARINKKKGHNAGDNGESASVQGKDGKRVPEGKGKDDGESSHC